ncbi:MAG: sigma-70 family RNA polymerase sigma factor [Acidobacteria bacterium]|nr:MAG: sigma-70 family RNA polymerase sigma factor [Acidobacteriota bacterium]
MATRQEIPDYAKLEDVRLIGLCLQGDARAWEALLKRYRRLIYSIPTRKYGLAPQDADDVFQAVCLALLERLGELREEARLVSWLMTTTQRECWRMRQRREMVSLDGEWEEGDDIPDPGRLPDEMLQTLQQQHLLRRGIEQLDERCQKLIRYLFYEKEAWSYERISRELGMPASSIGPTRGRCLKKLKRILTRLGLP